MMKGQLCLVVFIVLCILSKETVGDVYMHNPRGCNNRLNENSENRQNNNRLYNTQNNGKGGYAVGPRMYYLVGSYVPVEWTNQHGCGSPNVDCEIVLQYMCGDEVRDGVTTDSPPDDVTQYNNVVDNPDPTLYLGTTYPDLNTTDNSKVYQYGMHESWQYYQDCKTRQRNQGLFLADQNVGSAAINTRQNPGGGRSGFECPEERDYYPYWHPTPWIDVAILTTHTDRCSYYRSNSENKEGRYFCDGQPVFNNEGECGANGGVWTQADDNGGDNVDCIAAPYSRDNHLGNGLMQVKGQVVIPNQYVWKVPDDTNDNCILRIRYNITPGDVDFGLDSNYNSEASPVHDDPTIAFQDDNLTLALDTTQFGRTFQDRSYVFSIRSRGSIIDTDRIWNLNVRGKRGNIVQAYPAVEYDFVPNHLSLHEGDRVHFQWTGSKFNPQNNDGEGTRGTDVSNLIAMYDQKQNTFALDGANEHFLDDEDSYYYAHLGQTNCSTYAELLTKNGNNQDNVDRDPANCAKLNAASQYFDGGVQKFDKSASYSYMSTRNNNFSNRSQKGSIEITPFLPVWAIVLVVFASAVCLLSLLVMGVGIFSRFQEQSAIGQVWTKLTTL